jgi:hypothetical protein
MTNSHVVQELRCAHLLSYRVVTRVHTILSFGTLSARSSSNEAAYNQELTDPERGLAAVICESAMNLRESQKQRIYCDINDY